ncbi:MAG TPA: type II secretion system protein N [Gammaproteobacteria bacterium]
MKHWRWHILLFVAVYGVTLIATLPASLVLHWVEPTLAKLPQRPQLQGVDGTLWSGRAAQVSYRGESLGELHWQLAPWGLLLGRLNATLNLTGADGYLEGELSTGFSGERLQLREVTGQLPATLLKSFAPSLPVKPVGSFAVNVEEAVVEASHLRSLEGRIIWNKGGVAAPLALEFGDLAAQFSSTADGIAGTIKDSGGPLQVTADLKLAADGSYTLSGKSAAREGAAPALATSLSLLGQPDAQGVIPFRFNGRLPVR